MSGVRCFGYEHGFRSSSPTTGECAAARRRTPPSRLDMPPTNSTAVSTSADILSSVTAVLLLLPLCLWLNTQRRRCRCLRSVAHTTTVPSPACVRLRRAFYYHGWLTALDVAQSICSAFACILWIWEAAQQDTTATPADPAGASPADVSATLRALNTALTVTFTLDYGVRFCLARDRLSFFFAWISLVDAITIAAGWSTVLIYQLVTQHTSSSTADRGISNILGVVRVLRVFRVLRAVRMVRLAPTLGISRQIFMLIGTCLALVFCGAGFFQALVRVCVRCCVWCGCC